MGSRSPIEWLEGGATWNFLYGCTRVSTGCKHCYAARATPRVASRLARAVPADQITPLTIFDAPKGPPAALTYSGVVVFSGQQHLEAPLRWKRARRVFVNSLSDLFHESVPRDLIDEAFRVMRIASHHTYIVLTKRAERMREEVLRIARHQSLTNVWVGVSAEDQARLHYRAPALLDLPVGQRVLSLEPLLEHVNVGLWLQTSRRLGASWVIVGGESGRVARPCQERWVRSIVRSCAAAKVPVFVKQMGTAWATANWAGNPPSNGSTKGADPWAWPKDLQVRQLPHVGPRHK
jgi:protein gp37